MKTITQTIYLIASPASWEDSGYWIRINPCQLDDCITLNSMEVTMDIPENFDINSAHIEMLKTEQSNIQARAHLKSQNIENQIQALLAIEHKPVTDS